MDKVILITGTSSGLGLSLAVKLAEQGHCVYATMRNVDKQSALAEAAKNASVNLHIKSCDVQNSESVNRCVSEIIKEQGRIDCLINNAGLGFVKSTEQATEAEIDAIMNTNFMGVVRTVKAVLPHMRKVRKGHIINVTSVGGLVGQPLNEIYCASKFAVEGYTESLATYVQPAFNIKFSLVEPGGIVSEFASNLLTEHQKYQPQSDDEYVPIFKNYFQGAQERVAASEHSPYQTADEVAVCVIDVFNSVNPPLRVRSSDWANAFCELKTQADPDGTRLVKLVNELFL